MGLLLVYAIINIIKSSEPDKENPYLVRYLSFWIYEIFALGVGSSKIVLQNVSDGVRDICA